MRAGRLTALALLLASGLGLSGCQSWCPPAERPLAAPLDSSRQLEHRLRIERGEQVQNLHAVLRTLPGETRVVALTETGVSVLQLRQTADDLTVTRSPLLPRQVPARLILADIQLVFWPLESLRAALPTPWRLEQEEQGRALYNGARLEARVRYQKRDGWQGPATLDNIHHGYRLTITPLQPQGAQ